MMQTGVCEMKKEEVNKVVYKKDEIRMVNIRNRKKNEEDKEEGVKEEEKVHKR